MLTSLIAIAVLSPTTCSRPQHFFLFDLKELKRLAYDNWSTGSSQSKTTHALRLSFAHKYYFSGSGYSGQEAVLSIRKAHMGVCEDPAISNAGNGFDPYLATPSDNSTWFHFQIAPQAATWPPTLTAVNLAYFSSADDIDSTLNPPSSGGVERIVYREKATDSGGTHVIVFIFDLGILKNFDTGDCAIDTRKTFNNSNEANATNWFADANTALRNLNFDPYKFRGGMFVGHMPWQYNDRSGTARFQLWFDAFDLSPWSSVSPTPTLQFATTAFYDMGSFKKRDTGSDWVNSFDLGYNAGASGSTESNTTWATGWTKGSAFKTTTIPAWTPETNLDYVSCPITIATPTSDPPDTPSSLIRYFLAYCNDESTYISATSPVVSRWRYFATREYAPSNVGDKQPRVWGVYGVHFYEDDDPDLAGPETRRR